MFRAVLFNEWLKASRRSPLLWVVTMGPLLFVTFGTANYGRFQEVLLQSGGHPWFKLMSQTTLFYGLLFFPVLPGVLSSLVCRYEHLGGGWKQMLILPLSRSQVYGAKLLVVWALLALTQGLFYLFHLGAGLLLQLPASSIPWRTFLTGALLSWLAALPLAALQLALSVRWKSFALPLALNVLLAFPTLLVTQSRFAPFYPWAQPALAMLPQVDKSYDLIPFMGVTLSCLSLTVVGGWYYFCRRDVV